MGKSTEISSSKIGIAYFARSKAEYFARPIKIGNTNRN